MTIEHWVKYFEPGTLFREESSLKLASRSEQEAMARYPKNAYGFQFYDVEVLSGTLENGEPISKRTIVNKSPMYYPGARVLNEEDITALKGDHGILLSNMCCNGWSRVALTPMGNFQPFEENCRII